MPTWIERQRDEVKTVLMAVAAFCITAAVMVSVALLGTAITLAVEWIATLAE